MWDEQTNDSVVTCCELVLLDGQWEFRSYNEELSFSQMSVCTMHRNAMFTLRTGGQISPGVFLCPFWQRSNRTEQTWTACPRQLWKKKKNMQEGEPCCWWSPILKLTATHIITITIITIITITTTTTIIIIIIIVGCMPVLAPSFVGKTQNRS